MKLHIKRPYILSKLNAEERKVLNAVHVLRTEYRDLSGDPAAAAIKFTYGGKNDECSVKRTSDGYEIVFRQAHHALRMLGNLLAGIVPSTPERCPFDTIGVMLDCSRNKVFTVDYLKTYFRKLAILGYNMIMLYTEDVYQMDGEPYFGLMRGAYTEREIRDLDDYADSLGMELVPCIQSLGHLEQIFRWQQYSPIHDTGGVMLIDEERTYQLVEKMLVTWKSMVRSRRIHIGMDEAWGIGKGQYRDLHGDVSKFEMLNRHLKRVTELCERHGLKPMMWSDMYFRLGSKTGGYYDQDCVIPQDVIDGVPGNIQLVYWDYYHCDRKFYADWIDRHRKLAADTIMATSVRTPCVAWYDHFSTKSTVGPCLAACREKNVREVLFTIWGDDGALCDFNSTFAGLTFSSEVAYTGKSPADRPERKYSALFKGASYSDTLALANLTCYRDCRILWDDPIMLMFTGGLLFAKDKYQDCVIGSVKYDFDTLLNGFTMAAVTLARAHDATDGGNIAFARAYVNMILAKLVFAKAYLSAYTRKNRHPAVKSVIPLAKDYRDRVKAFIPILRKVWFSQAKPTGFETIQVRMAGQLARAEELIVRLTEFANGKVNSIPETDDLLKVAGDLKLSWVGWAQLSHGTTTV